MNESEFLRIGTAVLDHIEEAIDASGADVDFERKGDGVLDLEFGNGTHIVINLQAPMQQIWIAAKAGGFHFGFDGAQWRDTRSGDEFFAVLSTHASLQGDSRIVLAP